MTLEEAMARIEALEKSHADETARLNAHKEKLIEEKRKVQERNRELEESDAAKKMEALNAEIEALKKGGNTEDLNAAYEKRLADAQEAHDKRFAEIEQAKRDAEKRANDMVAKADLNAAIAKANISGPLSEAFTALIKEKGLEVNTAGDSAYAMIEGRKVGDWIADYTKTDVGKHFVSASGNSGSAGSSEPGAGSNPSSKKFADMTLTERTDLYNLDPAAYRAAKNKAA